MPTAAPAAANTALPPRRALRRLAGRPPSVRLSRAEPSARLWIGGGELVQELVLSYTQTVQRFAFADVQAMQIRRTTRGLVYNVVLAGLLAIVLLITTSIWSTDGSGGLLLSRAHLLVAAGISAPFLLLLLTNTLRGPTCRTVLVTALGPQRLISLSRLHHAGRAWDAVLAEVTTVQGGLRPDEAARQVDQALAQQGPRPTPAPTLPGY